MGTTHDCFPNVAELIADVIRKVAAISSGLLLASVHVAIQARGVSPYLPLNLEPEIESQIERVLILGDKPVMTRPIPAARVLEALPKACSKDPVLCHRVQRYLARYTHGSGITHASIEGAVTSGSKVTLPNEYGMSSQSKYQASITAYAQPSDYLIADVGAVVYQGKTDYTGTMLSLGFSYLQVDLGFRPHWLSPMSDSSMLMSTESATMPSLTLSNYDPISPLGIQYELFLARMSKSDHILEGDKYVSGTPRLAGVHLGIEPASGWTFGVNRLLQYGGDGRPSGLKDLFKAFFNPSKYDNTGPNLTTDQSFGNQQASITTSFLFPGKVPFSVYAEYAGEDTSRGRGYLLGNSALSVGIHFPQLWKRFDLTVEATEWQNEWYNHFIYQDGMVNYGHVTGNWFGDQRLYLPNAAAGVIDDAVGGNSQMVKLGYEPPFGGLFELRYRTLQNQQYGVSHYQRFNDISFGYSRPWNGMEVGGTVDTGKDVFGGNFTRVAGFIRYNDSRGGLAGLLMDDLSDNSPASDPTAQLFVEVGAHSFTSRIDLTDGADKVTGPRATGAHAGIGARRAVSEHNDVGARFEFDNVNGHSLVGVRLLDYRYRLNWPVAVGVFLGAARYDLATPAYGVYYGVGLQWLNVLPGWDIGADVRYYNSIARDHLLPSDPQTPRPDSFYDFSGGTVSISYHF